MAKRRMQTVRFVVHTDSRQLNYFSGAWIEQLRYAGVLGVLQEGEERMVLELYPPRGVDDITWARQNAERMRSFAITARATPAWDGVRALFDERGEMA